MSFGRAGVHDLQPMVPNWLLRRPVQLDRVRMAIPQVKGLPLRHLSRLSVPGLSLHLFTSPASSLDGTALKFAITLRFLDHLCDPFSTVVIGVFAVGECICQVSVQATCQSDDMAMKLSVDLPNDTHGRA